MSFGLDDITDPPIAALQAAGVMFLCRYVGYFSGYDLNNIATQQGKCLYPAEAKALLAAGISPVSNYEWYAERPSINDPYNAKGSASAAHAAGAWDAQTAQKIHLACGGPPGAAIYFSVDYDTDGTDTDDYFRGVSSVLGVGGLGIGRTGAYGPYACIKHLFDAGLITWGWQTYAWSNGQWDPRAHIHQYNNNALIAGLSVDYDVSMKPDFGQWLQGGSMIPTGWHDDGTTLTAPNGVHVVHGFRDYVLNHNWEADNWPLAAEFATASLEASNTSLGTGSQQLFRWKMLGYTTKLGVIFEWVGQELAFARQQVAKYYAQAQQLPGVQQQLQAAQAEIAALKAQPPITGIDPAKVKDRLTAIGLSANNGNTAIQQLVNQPL